MKYTIIIIASIFLQSIIANSQCYHGGDALPNTGYLVTSSGWGKLDSIVNDEHKKLEIFFGVKLDFFFLIEDYNANAMYSPYCNNQCQGTLMLGKKLLREQLQKENGIARVKAAMAHEFGHCVQALMGWKEWFVKPTELHSDFLAGFYYGKNYSPSAPELENLFDEFASMGKNGYYDFLDPQFHGTSDERMCAFLEGYYYAKESQSTVATASQYGVGYVFANNPCGIRKYYKMVNTIADDTKKGRISNVTISLSNPKDKHVYFIKTYDANFKPVTYFLNTDQYKTKENVGNYQYTTTYSIIKTTTATMTSLSMSYVYPVKIYRRSWFLGEQYLAEFKIVPSNQHDISIAINKRSVEMNYVPLGSLILTPNNNPANPAEGNGVSKGNSRKSPKTNQVLIDKRPDNISHGSFKVLYSEGKLRKTDSPTSGIVKVIPAGKEVKIISGPSSGVYFVEYDGTQGYLNELYFSKPK